MKAREYQQSLATESVALYVDSLPAETTWQVDWSQLRDGLERLTFLFAWALIGAVSVYDAYLVRKYQATILDMEQNPICAELIKLDPHGLSFFMVFKGLGTLTVLAVLCGIFCWRRQWALPVVIGVAAFQVGLLYYLNYGSI